MKKILIKMLVLFTSIVSIIFLFSFAIRKVAVISISNFVTNNIVISEIINKLDSSLPEIDDNIINKIKNAINNSPEIDDITEIYFDSLVKDLLDGFKDSPDITPNINRIIDSNITNELYPYKDQIKNIVLSIDFDEVYTNIYNYVKEMKGEELTNILFVYNILNSIKTKILCMIVIIVNLTLIVLLNKSILKSFNEFGKILTGTGIFQILMMIVLKGIMGYIDLSYMVIVSMIEVVIGTILGLIDNKKKK